MKHTLSQCHHTPPPRCVCPPAPQARDISRLSYNTKFFQPDVTFSDGVRSFKGADKYKAAMWCRTALKAPRAVSANTATAVAAAATGCSNSRGSNKRYHSSCSSEEAAGESTVLHKLSVRVWGDDNHKTELL